MGILTILISVVAIMVQHASARGSGAGGRSGFAGIGSGYGGGIGGSSGGFGGGGAGNAQPTPYNMGYEVPDAEGNVQFRQEQGDGNGNVRGSYGYTSNQGLYRVVEYTAGPAGYQATVKTNEPGTDGKESPADVIMIVEQTPGGIGSGYGQGVGGGGGGRGGIGGFNPMGGVGGSGIGGTAGGRFGGSGISSAGYPQGGQGRKSGKSGY